MHILATNTIILFSHINTRVECMTYRIVHHLSEPKPINRDRGLDECCNFG